MLHRSEEAKLSLVRSLANRAGRAASKSHKKNIRTFIERFYANIAPEDILNVLEEIRNDARTSTARSSKLLLSLRAAISSDGDSSLLTQMQKLRSDANDHQSTLIKEFRDFAKVS